MRLRPYFLDRRIILDVQQVIPLPEAGAYAIQLKKKAEENREAKRANTNDYSKYDLVVGGHNYPRLSKRRLILKVVKRQLTKAARWMTFRRLLTLADGSLSRVSCPLSAFRKKL